jgi:hypothetical protein
VVPSDRFAKVPADVVLSDLDDQCVRLYVWLALEIGGTGWERTVTKASKALRWQARTTSTHADHLSDAGLILVVRLGRGVSARMRFGSEPARPAHTPNGKDGNSMTASSDTESTRDTRTTYAPDAHPLGSRAGSSAHSRHALVEQPRSEGRRDERVARATVGRRPNGIYPGDPNVDGSVGHLGMCRICGKRWVFGPCEHAGPEDHLLGEM